jgi:hypothetical protein
LLPKSFGFVALEAESMIAVEEAHNSVYKYCTISTGYSVTGHRACRILGKYVPGHSDFGSMFLSFGVPNKQFFAAAAPEFFLKRQLEYFRSEYLWSQVAMGEYLVEIVQ